jgi:hypothetical protein
MTLKPWPYDSAGNRVARWLATQFLRLAEALYLFAYGWRDVNGKGDEVWMPPEGHPKVDEMYDRTHAVNSTRYYLNRGVTAQALRDRNKRPANRRPLHQQRDQ